MDAEHERETTMTNTTTGDTRTNVTIEAYGGRYSVEVHDNISASRRARGKDTRVYVSAPSPEDVLPEWAVGHPPYGSTRGDGSAEDAAWKAYNAAELTIERGFAVAVLAEVAERSALGDARLRWSRHAGCSCPCSPGYIVPRSAAAYRERTVWVTAKRINPIDEMTQDEVLDAVMVIVAGG